MDFTLGMLASLFSVVLIDLVLAGDNAVVVGCLAAGLPREQQRRVILFGIIAALLFRIAFALVAVQLLSIVGLLLAGGLLLLWVAFKMWRELNVASRANVPAMGGGEIPCVEMDVPPAASFRAAVIQVAVADLSMSLDNVLAVAGTAHNHPVVMVFGLILSVALMGLAAGIIARLIERHRWIAYLGFAIVTLVALHMIWQGGADVLALTMG
ncbi:MAG: YjbE family putative metal transport protein [Pseudomonadota bacterium]